MLDFHLKCMIVFAIILFLTGWAWIVFIICLMTVIVGSLLSANIRPMSLLRMTV
jgi:hypothetical protein